MSNQCVNILRFDGEEKELSNFLAWLEANSDLGKYLCNLEEEGEDEGLADNLPVESAHPWIDTFLFPRMKSHGSFETTHQLFQ